MNYEIPTGPTLDSSHASHTSNKPWYRRRLTVAIALLILFFIVASGLLLTMGGKNSGTSANQTLTLYYSDGKTLLWQTGQPEGENAAFIAYVRNQLKALHGDDYQSKGAWKVTTTLNKRLQETALEQFKSQRSAISMLRLSNLILMAEDVKTGQVAALATQQPQESGINPIAERIPAGTLATPFPYIALLEKSPDRASGTFEDTQTQITGYPCSNRNAAKQGGNCLFNMDMRYTGTLSLAQALGGVRNVTAAKALLEVGSPAATATIAKMGSDGACYADQEFTQKTTCYTAAAFGEGLYVTPQHMMQTYSTLANQGSKVPQSVVIKTILGDKQQYVWHAPAAERAISNKTAQVISDVLADPNVSYLPDSRKTVFNRSDGKKVSVVSGYTQQSTHASSIQFTDQYAVGFWGSGNGAELAGSPVTSIALPIAAGLLNATD